MTSKERVRAVMEHRKPALLAALAAVGAWKYTNGNFYALPEQLRALLTEHVPRPGATLV